MLGSLKTEILEPLAPRTRIPEAEFRKPENPKPPNLSRARKNPV